MYGTLSRNLGHLSLCEYNISLSFLKERKFRIKKYLAENDVECCF